MRSFKHSVLVLSTFCVPFHLTALSSCSILQNDGISVVNSSSWSQNGVFTYIINFDNQPSSDVLLEIFDEKTGDIFLKQNRLAVVDRLAKIETYVPNRPETTTGYYFNIKCFYVNDSGRKVVTNLWDMSSIYEIVEKQNDLVEIDSKSIERTNSHYFQFMFEFWKEPQCSSVEIEILNDRSRKLSLKNSVVPFSGEQSRPYVLVDVILDLSVFLTQSFYFDVSLTFTNSMGEKQVSFFTNLSVSFVCDKQDEIPLDYLDFTPINRIGDETFYELHGLKPNVSKVEGGHYSILKVPENVVSIDGHAFNDKNWFVNIHKIILPKTVDKIGSLAFEGCQNILEFDASAYNDENVPNWIQNPQALFSSETRDLGYAWIDILNWDPGFDLVKTLGLPTGWLIRNFSRDVIPSSLYEFNDDKTEITKLKDDEESIQTLKTRSIIKIPDTVKTIGEDAFKILKTTPYEKNDMVYKYGTRRLILNQKMEELPDNIFSFCGISGPIRFAFSEIESIGNGAFENADKYGYWPGLLNVDTEPFNLYFEECPEMNNFGSFAFNLIKCANQSFIFPKYLSTIGSYAFQGNNFENIVFQPFVDDIGDHAFSNIYYRKDADDIWIKSIDISCYNYIRNPELRESDQTCMPTWMNETEWDTFLDSCLPLGTIFISQKMMDEINSKPAEEKEKWIQDFKDNQGIPSNWQFQVK